MNPQVLADFAAIRQAKRKGPVTAAVIEEMQQAHLAGLTLEQALQTCCDPRRRWALFEAGWLQAAPGGCAISPAATAATPEPEFVASGRAPRRAARRLRRAQAEPGEPSCGTYASSA